MNWAKFGDYGLIGLFMGVVLIILFKMITWVMEFVKEQSTSHSKERQTWMEIISTMKQSIDIHNQNSIESCNTNAEAHRFQRSEHEKMIDNLTEVNKCLYKLNGHS